MGIFGGSNDLLGNLTWINTNIRQNHGPLGAIYPIAAMGVDGLKEGDTPSFLYLVSAAHGMNNPEDPSQESWGGQYVRAGNTNHWVDGPGTSSISRWKSQYQSEFAQRADWMLDQSTSAHFLKIEDEQSGKVVIYPNPLKNELNIKSEFQFDTLRIFNLEGRLLFERGFNNKTNQTSIHLNLSKGIYLLKLSNAEFSTCTKIEID
jgi:hypothetical protein